MSNDVKKKAKKSKSTKKLAKKTKFILLMLLLFLLGLYLVVSVIYNNGNFSITLDDNLYYEKSLIIYDNPDYKVYRSELYAPAPESFDNISYYWSEIVISDVIRNVDEAVRIRVYKDDQYVTYAKARPNGTPENNTVAFVDDELVAFEHIENFSPGDKIKYTIVLWIEGSDLECTDNILGGEIKVQMNFNSEFVDEKEGKKKWKTKDTQEELRD